MHIIMSLFESLSCSFFRYVSKLTIYLERFLPGLVAIKMLRDRPTRQMGQAFIREASRIRLLNHDNVIKLVAVHFSTNPLLMALEYMPFGDLKSLLRLLEPKNGADSLITDGMYCDYVVIIHLIATFFVSF